MSEDREIERFIAIAGASCLGIFNACAQSTVLIASEMKKARQKERTMPGGVSGC